MISPSNLLVEVGVDEAGRGPLFGPVVAAAVIMPTNEQNELCKQIKDSKKCSPKKRTILKNYIIENAVAYGIGIATVEEIDQYNILQANYMAMHRALDQIAEKQHFDKIMVDGPLFKPYISKVQEPTDWVQHECIVDGDNTYLCIAAASILAKTYRDELIEKLCLEDPSLVSKYGISKNKGYGTKQHMDGLKLHGPSPLHRKSFKPVQNLINT